MADIGNDVIKGVNAAGKASKAADVSSAFGNGKVVSALDGVKAGTHSYLTGEGGSETLDRIAIGGGTAGVLAGGSAEGIGINKEICG